MKRSALLLAFVLLIFASGIALAQHSDVAVSGTGVFTNRITGSGLAQTATASGGFLISYRHIAHHGGIEVSYGYTQNSQRYGGLFGSATSFVPIQTGMNEVTADYVYRASFGRIKPFALAGGGLIIFDPTSAGVNAAPVPISHQTRVAFLYGAGIDVGIVKFLALRAQYRGLFYEAPDFGASPTLHTGSAMHSQEPAIGLVFRF